MKILYELSWLWETLGIALVAAAVCVACATLICNSDRPDTDAALIGRRIE